MIKERIKEAIETETDGLKLYCLETLEEQGDDEEIKGFIGDLINHGCQSGMVTELIYYADTIKFYDKFEDDIEDLISENMEGLGIETRPLFIESLNGSAENMTQEKNLLSWFAFEETVRRINGELEINKDYI